MRPTHSQIDGGRYVAIIALWLVTAGYAGATPAVEISFDGPDTRWQLLSDGNQARIVTHELVPDGAQNADGAESMLIVATAGQSALVACAIGRMPVLDEFQARLWVKSSRPGTQLAVRVIFPRSIDARTGAAATTIVRGPHTQQAGQWQQLELTRVPELLDDQIRVLRATASLVIDPREAYVDAVVLAVPGDPRGTEILTDELAVDGVLILETESQGGDVAGVAGTTGPRLQGAVVDVRDERGRADRSAPQRVRLQGTSLMVDGKPFAPRAIEWNGEPLDFLAQRGFNTIELRQPPTSGQRTLAERNDLWFICPPPPDAPAEQAANGDYGDWERVLAWRLEDREVADDVAHFRNWAEVVRGRDDLPPRPIIIAPQHEWAALSEVADILMTRHALDGTAAPKDVGEWLAERGRFARPGTPLWASIGTQFDAAASAQAGALVGDPTLMLGVEDDQIEALARVAVMQGCHGVLFRSRSPLNANDPNTRRRAALLELVNRQLQLIGPWIAGGATAGGIISAGETAAAVLWVDQARLLLPTIVAERATGSNSQYAASNFVAPRSFIVPGVPDSYQAFSLTPVAMRQLTLKRVAGGSRVVLESADDAMVVITQDAQVISGLRQAVARDGAATIRLARDVAAMRASAIAETDRRLAAIGKDTRESEQGVASATALLRQADPFLSAGRLEPAYTLVRSARRLLRQATEQQWASVGESSPLRSFPLAISYDTLVAHAQFLHSTKLISGGENLLYGGDFEDIDQLTQFGWQHFYDPTDGIEARAELSSAQPYHGRFALQLTAEPTQTREAALVSKAFLRIISPPVAAEAGQLVEISGWARVTAAAQDGSSVLEIEDPLGGPEMALRVSTTAGWQPFRVIRTTSGGAFRVAFSLIGPGSAELDAVMVRPLRQPVARRLPQTVPPRDASLQR